MSDDWGRRAGMALAGFAIALALYATVGEMGSSPAEPPPHEEPEESLELTQEQRQLLDALGEAHPEGFDDYSDCASLIGCYEPGRMKAWLWELEKLEMIERGEELVEPASNCVGFCFNATVESVDDENWRIANVVIVGQSGKRTRAIVERTRVSSSSRDPAAEGKPVRFACYDRVRGEGELRFESCSQMAVLE